jgi:glucosylceramidase
MKINSKSLFFSFTLLMLLVSKGMIAQKVKMVSTTETERWVKSKKDIKIIESTAEADIVVYSDSILQVVDGFGGSFNELGYTALQVLPKEGRKEVMEALFSEDGCDFTMCRLPLGASDYALSYYSSNDVPEDFGMRDFNIDRDRFIMIPYIKQALDIQPNLKLWASPWSPPAWMKVNEHYSARSGDWNGRPQGNRMTPGAEIFNNATGFKMQERYLKAYALYFSKFVQQYKAAGVPLWAIMPQNEVAYAPNWPACTWRPEDMAYFIGKFLGPKFKEDNLSTEIWLGTINAGNPDYVRTILDNKDASKYLSGVGFQWGGSKSIPTITKEYPSYKFMQTENKCGNQENNWSSLQVSWETLVHYTNSGSGSYMYWNMILDETGMSSWGWPQNSMIVIDKNTKEVTYNDEFYLFKHLSHFVKPGDNLLKSSKGKNHIAYKSKDGSTVILVNNPNKENKTIKIKVGSKTVLAKLKATSINTILVSK